MNGIIALFNLFVAIIMGASAVGCVEEYRYRDAVIYTALCLVNLFSYMTLVA